MALITRFTRLFQADLHAVMDRIEEPDVLLRQALREMDADIAKDDQRSRALQHELTQTGARKAEIEQSLRQIDDEIDLCFDSGNHELVRTFLRRKLEAHQLQQAISRRDHSVQASLAEIAARLKENRQRLTAMQQKSELLAEDDSDTRCDQFWSIPQVAIRDEDVEVAFISEKKRRNLL